MTLNIAWLVPLIKFPTTHLPGHNIMKRKAIIIYILYFSIVYAKRGATTFTSLNQSNGGIGSILNTASAILINAKSCRNVSIISLLPCTSMAGHQLIVT
jgi:hypothetical protein